MMSGFLATVAAMFDNKHLAAAMAFQSVPHGIILNKANRYRPSAVPSAKGGTRFSACVNLAAKALAEMEVENRLCIIFTDGDIRESEYDDFFSTLFKNKLHNQVQTHVIALGDNEEAMMRKFLWALSFDVTVHFLKDIGTLPAVFENILTEFSKRIKQTMAAKGLI